MVQAARVYTWIATAKLIVVRVCILKAPRHWTATSSSPYVTYRRLTRETLSCHHCSEVSARCVNDAQASAKSILLFVLLHCTIRRNESQSKQVQGKPSTESG